MNYTERNSETTLDVDIRTGFFEAFLPDLLPGYLPGPFLGSFLYSPEIPLANL